MDKKRIGVTFLIVLTNTIGATVLLPMLPLYTAANSMSVAVRATLAYSFGFAISWPSLQSIMTKLGTKKTVGIRLGLFQSTFSLALIGASILAGLVMENIGTRQIFHVGGLLSTIGIVLGVVLMHLPLPGRSPQDISDEHQQTPLQRGFLGRFH